MNTKIKKLAIFAMFGIVCAQPGNCSDEDLATHLYMADQTQTERLETGREGGFMLTGVGSVLLLAGVVPVVGHLCLGVGALSCVAGLCYLASNEKLYNPGALEAGFEELKSRMSHCTAKAYDLSNYMQLTNIS